MLEPMRIFIIFVFVVVLGSLCGCVAIQYTQTPTSFHKTVLALGMDSVEDSLTTGTLVCKTPASAAPTSWSVVSIASRVISGIVSIASILVPVLA